MDEELLSFEAELRRLRPAVPSAGLTARIAEELQPAVQRRRKRGQPWYWSLVFPAVAAGVALLGGVVGPRWERSALDENGKAAAVRTGRSGPTAATALKPIQVENVLLGADDEGLVTLADGTQARRERLRYIDTVVWKNTRTNASLTWSVPREEVRVVPIVFQ